MNEVTADAFLLFAKMNDASLQKRLWAWQVREFGEQPPWVFAAGASEEIGELWHAILKHQQGIRGMDDETAYLEAVGDAIADASIFLVQLATSHGLDYNELLHGTAHEVMKRKAKSLAVKGSD